LFGAYGQLGLSNSLGNWQNTWTGTFFYTALVFETLKQFCFSKLSDFDNVPQIKCVALAMT
jgi:hypothetical protein